MPGPRSARGCEIQQSRESRTKQSRHRRTCIVGDAGPAIGFRVPALIRTVVAATAKKTPPHEPPSGFLSNSLSLRRRKLSGRLRRDGGHFPAQGVVGVLGLVERAYKRGRIEIGIRKHLECRATGGLACFL